MNEDYQGVFPELPVPQGRHIKAQRFSAEVRREQKLVPQGQHMLSLNSQVTFGGTMRNVLTAILCFALTGFATAQSGTTAPKPTAAKPARCVYHSLASAGAGRT